MALPVVSITSQQWPGIVAILFAACDVLYYVAAWCFVAMWFENHPILPLVRGLLRRLFQYALILSLLFSLALDKTNNNSAITPTQNVATVLWVCGAILTAILSLCGWRNTRKRIVEGGPYHAPSALLEKQTKVIVVTGANTGIGKETVEILATSFSKESTILLLCRSVSKGEIAIANIQANLAKQQKKKTCCVLQVVACDLSSLQSVRDAAEIIHRDYKTVNILINNAGVMLNDLTYTKDGYESCLQANYLGHFLLTSLLMPYITERIVNLTSSTYRLAIPSFDAENLDDLNCQNGRRKFSLFGQYAATKWCNILHTISLSYKFPTIKSCAVHPGLVRTSVVRNMPWYLKIPNTLFAVILAQMQKTPFQGAWCTIYTATTEEIKNGCYWMNRTKQCLCLQDSNVINDQAEKVWLWSCRQVNLTEKELLDLQTVLENEKNAKEKVQ